FLPTDRTPCFSGTIPAQANPPQNHSGQVLVEDLDELQEALTERCVGPAEQPELIRSHTLYHWWSKTA
ncbi:MAG: hypothetical protein M3P51_08380, partial [Chloroflexota bacterium]|nr:hypothetical protein [Chloroflexota bacterium]